MSERSIWKKEISFRRKRKVTISWEKREPTVEAPAAVSAAAVPAAKPEVSFWKREITLGRRKPVEAAQASEPAPAAPAPVPTTAAPTPATPAAPVRETETAQPAQPTTWQSAIELAAYQTEPSASVVADREETVETVPVLPAVEPAPARPDPEPAPLPEAPKVAAAAKADVPFWKREVVIGRRPAPKDTAPEAPVETQVHAEPAVSEPDLDETFETWPAPPTIETAATVPVAEGVPEVEPPAVPAP